MLNIPFYFLFSLLTDDAFPPKTMEFRHFAMGKVRSAPEEPLATLLLSRRTSARTGVRSLERRAFGRPSGRSLAASRHDASNAVTLASVASNRIDGTRSSALGARASTPRGRSSLCTG